MFEPTKDQKRLMCLCIAIVATSELIQECESNGMARSLEENQDAYMEEYRSLMRKGTDVAAIVEAFSG